jgi:NitT/TauT family transport system permease protein
MNLRAAALAALRYLVSLTLFVAVWWAAVRLLRLPPFLLAPPDAVLKTLTHEWPTYQAAAAITFGNMAVGAAVGIPLALLVGGVAALSRRLRWVTEPYFGLFQSFPKEALLPLLVVWLGFGNAPKMVSAGLLAFFPMAVITLNSLTDTRDDYLRLMESWKASRLQVFLHCRAPAALPALVAGLKVCLPLALIGAVLGEFLGGNGGLGYLINAAGGAARIDRLFAAVAVLALGGTLIVGAIDAIRLTVLRPFYQR